MACGQVVVESDSDAARATASVMVDVTMGATEKACDYLEPKTVRYCHRRGEHTCGEASSGSVAASAGRLRLK